MPHPYFLCAVLCGSKIINGPWLLVGDLNEVLSSSEVLGGSFSPSRAFILSTMMDDCSFIDMDTVGGLFTWRKNVQNGGHTRKRLDRCMADVAWHMHFPDALVELLPPHNSDHNPLLVSCSKSPSKRVKSFHFQASWISHPDYGSLVRSTWNNTPGDVTFKLHKIMEESQTFNTEIFGNIFHNKRRLEARLSGVHKQLDVFASSDLIMLEKELQDEYSIILAQEEMMWYQKSRENWVCFGNKNTKFFHTQTIIRRRRNRIIGLNIDGSWCTNDNSLKQEALHFFRTLFISSEVCYPNSLHLQNISQIDPNLAQSLVAPVSP